MLLLAEVVQGNIYLIHHYQHVFSYHLYYVNDTIILLIN
jgi:hypothetical protein